jgi:GT2 family glycosyltransferase
MAADATIIIPQHDQAALTLACIESFRRFHAAHQHIVVVDDGSSAWALTTVVARLVAVPNVTVLTQQHLGPTAAWNLAAEQAGTKFLVFLNNDTISVGPWLDALLEPLRSEVAPLSGVTLRRERHLPPDVLFALPTVEFLEGWCFAVSREDWCGVGAFDEDLRLYFSDTDFQAQVLRRYGRGVEALASRPDLRLRHVGHCSTRRLAERSRVWREDRERFIRKWRRSRQQSAVSNQ